MGKAIKDLLGWWLCKEDEKDVTTYFNGISQKFRKAQISYTKGCEIDSFKVPDRKLIPKAVKRAQQANVVILVLGEQFWMRGEGGRTTSLHLPVVQEELFEATAKTVKSLITVINTGRTYILNDIDTKSDVILYACI